MCIVKTVLLCALLAGLPPAEAAESYVRELATHGDLVRWVGYSPDGKILASASFDGAIRWSDAANGRTLKMIKAGSDKKSWAAFSADGATFVAGSNEPQIRIWNAPSAKLRHTLTGPHTAAWAGGMTADGRTLVSGGPEGTLAKWDAMRGLEKNTYKTGAAIWCLSLSPKGDEVAAGADDGRVRIYSMNSGEQRLTFGNHRGGVYCIVYASDGSLIATAGADAVATIWDAKTGDLKHALPHFGAVHAVAFSADSRQLAAGGADDVIKLWDAQTGAFVRKLAAHNEPVWCVAFAADGAALASGGADRKVLVWDLTRLPGHLAKAGSLPRRVDLRPRMEAWKLEVVAQQNRNTCGVHTFTRALEWAVSKQLDRGTPLSDEYMNWACNQVIGNTGSQAQDRGQFFEHLWMGVRRNGYCPGSQMPWREAFDPENLPSEKVRQSAKRPQPFRVYWHDIGGPGVADDEVVSEIKTVLSSGWPVLAGSPHNVLIVGYVDDKADPGGGRFLIADSGTGGFVTEATADKLHSAITYNRMRDYGFSWLESVAEKAGAAESGTSKRKK
jgi:hypothetical protein